MHNSSLLGCFRTHRLPVSSRRSRCITSSTGSHSSGSSSTRPSTTAMQKLKRQEVLLQPQKAPAECQFKVLQWNVLADGLAQNGDFVKVAPECLEWEFRRPLVLQEIQESQADIICLQEINKYEELCTMLEHLGYTGAFFPKYCSPAERYKCPPDGLAIFYRTTRFESMGNATGHTFLDDKGQKQSQGFLHVLLHDKVVGNSVLVATTHLKAKEGAENDEVRLKQADQLLAHITHALLAYSHEGGSNGNGTSCSGEDISGQQCAAELAQAAAVLQSTPPASRIPVVITGDFNTTPMSTACQVINGHFLKFRSIWSQGILLSGGSLALPGSLTAASMSMTSSGDAIEELQPTTAGTLSSGEFSTWKFRSKGESKRIIDYIWFTEGSLRPLSRWRMLSEAEIGPTALPSKAYASDHIALCATFEWAGAADRMAAHSSASAGANEGASSPAATATAVSGGAVAPNGNGNGTH